MLKINTYTIKGTKTEGMSLPKEYDREVNLALLAQALRVYEERSHTGLRQAKTRSEVNRTTKKVYKQKGTGGARHGSRRAPIYVGGGVAFGPRALRRIVTLPQELKIQSKLMAFIVKASENKLVAVSGLNKIAKTKDTNELLKVLGKETGAKSFTFVLGDKAAEARKFLRNIGNAMPFSFKDINAFDIFHGGLVILDEEIFAKKEKKK